MSYTNNEETIIAAAMSLAAVCDHATSQDGQGYNGRDAEFMHSVVMQHNDGRRLTQKQLRAMYIVLRTYEKQLLNFGIKYGELTEPDLEITATISTNEIDPSWLNFKVNFGKHKGKSIGDIYKEAPDYVEWLARESFMGDVKIAAEYVVAGKPIPQPEAPKPVDDILGSFKITFGKHKNETMGDVWLSDSSYISWLAEKSYMEDVRKNAQAIIDNDPAHVEHLKEKKVNKEKLVKLSNAVSSDSNFTMSPKFGHGKTLYPYQNVAAEFLERAGGCAMISDTVGLGKAQPLGSKILTPTGWNLMADMKIGKPIINSKGKTSYVIGVYPQGELPVYQVKFTDGSSTMCTDDHLWLINTPDRNSRGYPSRLKTLKEIRSELVTSKGRVNHSIPMVEPIEFEEQILPLDPYLLGVLLGDGSFTRDTVHLSSADDEIIRSVQNIIPKGHNLNYINKYDYNIVGNKQGIKNSNKVTKHLRDMGLQGHRSETKFIPDIYRFASISSRISILQGLLDTDGYISRDNTIEFSSASKTLAMDVRFLVQSLGGKTTYHVKKTTHLDAHRLIISLPSSVIPFRLTRKLNRYHIRTKYPPFRGIKSVEYVDDMLCQCIATDSSDQLYITDDCIVTHNTPESLTYLQNHPEARPAVIVCPKSVKLNWYNECYSWLSTDDFVEVIGNKNDWMGDIIIINYDITSKNLDKLKEINPKILILDECHRVKNYKAKRTIAITELANQIPHKILLSATNIMNRPSEFWTQLQIIAPEIYNRQTFHTWHARYTAAHKNSYGWDFSGHSNLDKLAESLKPVMLRRTEEEVFDDLPEMIRSHVVVPITNRHIYNKARDNYIQFVQEERGKIAADRADRAEHLTRLTGLKKIVAEGKLQSVVEFVKDYLQSEEKIIIFAHHKSIISLLMKEFNKIAVKIDGSTPMKERELVVKRFEEDKSIKVFIGQNKAAGEGISLGSSKAIIFVEFDWTPAVHEQAEGRLKGLRQKGRGRTNTFAYYFVADKTIDEEIIKMLENKRQVVNGAVGVINQKMDFNFLTGLVK